jgi:nucleotide-binding universal stress UspA family protein
MTVPVVVAVEDSRTGLRTAAVAIDLAAALGAPLVVVHVVTDGAIMSALIADRADRAERPVSGVVERRRASGAALLRHVETLARRAGVSAETAQLEGDPAPRILDAARRWSAGYVVIGRSERGNEGPHYVGAQTRHVLEFAEQPVLVVPLGASPPVRASSRYEPPLP